jgi:murein DD-endopeptidase MepM/ murein hydrolase activator NlpD
MKYLGYKVLLSLLKVLVQVKRGIFWFGSKIFAIGKYFQNIFESTVGFRLYKVQFFLKKRFDRSKNPLMVRILDFLGSRGSLQIVVFGIFLFISFPHSSLFTDDSLGLPGRKTVLYQLLGPGDQDFADIEEIQVETISQQPTTNWRQGSIASEDIGTPIQNSEENGISGYGPGGGAIVKPNILPGGNVPAPTAPGQTDQPARKQIVEYTVQNGDVIGGIASRYGVTVNTILWANNLTFRSYIRPGDILKIPPGNGVMHVVVKGESLGKIARIYGVKSDDIAVENGLRKDGTNLSVGAKLFIPGGSKIASIASPPRVIDRNEGSIGKELEKVAAPPPSINAPAGSGYIWPTTDHRINQYYGLRHTGVDIAGKIGNPNYAVADGKVIKSQCGWNGGYGCYVIIDHGSGVTSLYGHNSKLIAEVGEYVTQGQVIGLLGSTGRSTGPHIHFEIRVGGKRVNPLKYVR